MEDEGLGMNEERGCGSGVRRAQGAGFRCGLHALWTGLPLAGFPFRAGARAFPCTCAFAVR